MSKNKTNLEENNNNHHEFEIDEINLSKIFWHGTDNYSTTFIFNSSPMDGSGLGNEVFIGGSNYGSGGVGNNAFGDTVWNLPTFTSPSISKGGNDVMIGGSNYGSGNVFNNYAGDGYMMQGGAKGGNDVMIGGNNTSTGNTSNTMVGEAMNLGESFCGNDYISGGNNSGSGKLTNTLIGDGQIFGGSIATFGNDTLVGGANKNPLGAVENILIGDASNFGVYAVNPNIVLGNDTLIAGSGVNTINKMWGDNQYTFGTTVAGGADNFIFQNKSIGVSLVEDFRHADGDKITFGIDGIDSIKDLVITNVGADTHITAKDSHISGEVTIVGVHYVEVGLVGVGQIGAHDLNILHG